MWAPSPKLKVLTYTDASSVIWGGFTDHINGKPAVGSWSEEESGRSSTFCEFRVLQYLLGLYSEDFQGENVFHKTNNKNAEIIMSVDSPSVSLQSLL